MNRFFFSSLRTKYTVIALASAILITVLALFAHFSVSESRSVTSSNITTRNLLLEHSRLIRDNLWQAKENLEAFLLDPLDNFRKEQTHIALRNAMQETKRLSQNEWILSHEQHELLPPLEQSLLALDDATTTLIATRRDTDLQYPSLTLANRTLIPANQKFLTAVQLAITELENEKTTPNKKQLYADLVQSRHLWTQTISLFRLYMTNKLGGFSLDTLASQESDIQLMLDELNQNINPLYKKYKKNGLGFQAGESIKDMYIAANDWTKTYSKVLAINHSDNWRTDAQLLKNNIAPLFNSVWALLLSLDVSYENSAANDVSELNNVAQTQRHLLWIISGTGLLFIAVGFFILQNSVLRPMAKVVQALKNVALQQDFSTLPAPSSTETRDLVDAFYQMQKQVQSRQTALEHQALHDTLTNLPNRTLLMDRLRQCVNSANRERKSPVLLMMDLDRFKEVNDTLGHQIGDSLLEEVGQRLTETLRKSDTVARLGGDEFAILLSDADAHQAITVASKIMDRLSAPISIREHQLMVGSSIGIAVYGKHGDDPETLIRHADVAMYVAKRNRLGYRVYDANEDIHSVARLSLLSDLKKALDENELKLYYQPQINTIGTVMGAEALLRWQHPVHGFVPPDQIVALSEQTGLIKQLTKWVLNTAARQFATWKTHGIDIRVAVNLSAYNLLDSDIIHQTEEVIDSGLITPEKLALEVTESAMIQNPKKAIDILNLLDELGVTISIDDFGTGFSSLSYLKRLPLDELKIDRSFVMEMIKNKNDGMIVRTIIDLAHNMALSVVAEGVEDQATLTELQKLGCDSFQGFYYSKPIPGDEFVLWYQTIIPSINKLKAGNR